MNNRQKAKHFKRLYEESLPKKPYPVVYQYVDNFQLYRVKQCIAFDDIICVQDPNLVKTCIENRILQEIRPLIFDRLNVKKDPYTEGYIYSLDLYLGKETNVPVNNEYRIKEITK